MEVVEGLEETSKGIGGVGSIGINEVKANDDGKQTIEGQTIIIKQQWPFEAPGWE